MTPRTRNSNRERLSGPLAKVLDRLGQTTRSGPEWSARCPSHPDRKPSLSVSEGDDGKVLIHCHAGCDPEEIVAALGLTMSNLFPTNGRPAHGPGEVPKTAAAMANELAGQFRRAMTPTRRLALARQLGVRPSSLTRLGVGWASLDDLRRLHTKCSTAGAYTFPMYDSSGVVIGIRLRTPGGRKYAVKGGKNGLFVPDHLTGDGPLLVAEGASDTAALLDLGFDAIGRPDCNGGTEHIVEMVRQLPPDAVVVVGDDDAAGIAGAESLAAEICQHCSVKVVVPPAKDVRAFVHRLRTAGKSSSAIRRRIERLVEGSRLFSKSEGRFPQPVPISQLPECEDVRWLWHGYLALGHVTLFVGYQKAGKTTLIVHFLQAIDKGGSVGSAVGPARVLVVSEESWALWKRRRKKYGLSDKVHLICRPLNGRPTSKHWAGFVRHLAALVKRHNYDAVLFDTISALWPVANENDASEVNDALRPLHAVCEAGAAVLLCHHIRKSDAAEGQASRGSGALTGFTDVNVEFRRYNPGDRHDRRRVLTGYSRFDETAAEMVLELTDDGYTTVGSKSDTRQCDRLNVIEGILPHAAPGMEAKDVRKAWPTDGTPKPGIRTAQGDLRHGVRKKMWVRTGKGARGDPHRFHRLDNSVPASIGGQRAGKESGSTPHSRRRGEEEWDGKSRSACKYRKK